MSYSAEGHTARKDLRVLGEAIGLRASSRALNLTEVGDTAELTVDGFDSDGRSARIESRDLEVEASDGIDVSVDELGTYVVTATDETAGGSVTFRAGDATTSVPVTVGTEVTDVVDFGDVDAFSDETARATGSFSAGEPTDDGQPSLAMEYDFSQSSATRGYYLISNDPVTVDGNTLAFEMMVHGDGTGAWPRLQVRGADGVVTNLDGDHLDFEGWQKVRFEVPAGLAQPLTFERIRIMETRPGRAVLGRHRGGRSAGRLHARGRTHRGHPRPRPGPAGHGQRRGSPAEHRGHERRPVRGGEPGQRRGRRCAEDA